ncbi:hypothetical protein K440DRAFT_565065, partial [Wilcoxina mikolae CBS 423.85]
MPYAYTSIEYDEERKECLNTLRFDNTRYSKISKEHLGSLEWLWKHEQYKEWATSEKSRLFYIQGKPGSGKSTLVRYFKDNFLERGLNGNSITASFFYSYREGELQTSHYSMLRSILYDVLHQEESFFYHFQPEYRQYQKHGCREWSYESLKKILASFRDHPRVERLNLIIDAVDESDQTDRLNVIRLLFALCSGQNALIVKVFIASRPVAEIEHLVKKAHNFMKLEEENESDIIKLTHATLQDLDLTGDLLLRATNHIIQHAQGVFLWVHLIGQELFVYAATGCSKKEIFDVLMSLPTELEDLYDRILERLAQGKDRDIRDGIQMFQFVLFTYRPLAVPELHHALAILNCPNDEYIASEELFEGAIISGMEKRIMHCGGNILEIKNSQGTSIVQFMHQTVREFFLRDQLTPSVFKMSGDDAHIRISKTCIRYLILCASNELEKSLPNIEVWNSQHFEEYARYLSGRPLINYTLSHLKHHIHCC